MRPLNARLPFWISLIAACLISTFPLLADVNISGGSGSPAQATYAASVIGIVPIAAATDIFVLGGSATKTVKAQRVSCTGTQTTGGEVIITLVKRLTQGGTDGGSPDGADGGVPTTASISKRKTANATATAVVTAYPYLPATGTSSGWEDVQSIFIAPSTAAGDIYVWTPGALPSQQLELDGIAEGLAVNLNGATVTGGSFNCAVVWTEE